MIDPVRIIRTTPQLTAFIPIKVPQAEVRKIMGPALAELRETVAAQGIAVTGPWFTHHLSNPGAIFDFEICLPVAAPVKAAGRARPGQWPAMSIAQTIYHGRFEGLGAAWGEFMEKIKAAGHQTSEGLWERYLVGPESNGDPSAWRTELSKPLAAV
jgi:effector-binding domain-containing protein